MWWKKCLILPCICLVNVHFTKIDYLRSSLIFTKLLFYMSVLVLVVFLNHCVPLSIHFYASILGVHTLTLLFNNGSFLVNKIDGLNWLSILKVMHSCTRLWKSHYGSLHASIEFWWVEYKIWKTFIQSK